SVIDDDAGVPALTTAADAADVMYISDTASNAVGASIRDLAIGVVAEDVSNWQILMYGASNSTGFTNTTQMRIADNTVFPTSSFSVGTVTTAPSAISHSNWRDDVVPLPAGAVPLIEQTANADNKFLVTFEAGSAMYSANSAAGRRVLGGWANASTSSWGTNLDTIVARSLIWAAGILVVNSTADGADASAGDGLCSTGGTNSNGDAECTLRAAIQEANAASAVERIVFEMPATESGHSGGIWTIAVGSALPTVTATVRIDAQTQPGWAGNPIVVVDGSATGGGADGFTLDGSNSELRGFVIRDFPDDGVNVDGTGGHTVAGNWIGLAPDGSTADGVTDDGIAIRAGSTNNTIGGPGAADRNAVSANGGEGILDQQGGNVIEGNYFGTDSTGLLDRGNGDEGVDLNNSPSTVVRNNVISGNGGEGMQILGSNGSVITGNFIGVGADGTTPIGNDDDGITINFGSTDSLQIGGISPGEGNVIAHNGDEGVTVFENGSDDNAILGNSIHSNGALGIDHGGAGVSANDANDTDSGPNDGLNFPVIAATTSSTVDFDLDVPAGDYLVEAFRNPSGNDATGNGEGEVSLGFHQINHTGSGSESFTGTYSGILSGGDITMTATECTTGACTAFGSTSEFSVAAVPTAAARNLVMVTADGSTSTNAKVTVLAGLFAGWGWTVTAVDDGAGASALAAAAAANDVMFVSESVGSSAGDAVRGLDIGIVNEDFSAISRLLYSGSGDQDWSNETTISIVDNSHPITDGLSLGSLTVHSSSDDVNYWDEDDTSLPAGVTVLADSPTSSDEGALFVADTGATLYSANTATNRRVWFPSDGANPTVFTTDYETLLERSLDWAANIATACGVADSDADGLLDCEEDADTDLDDDPSTNPGPDTDGDTTANYLDADDDGDGVPTASENADPNGDGNPQDALDTDRDGQPDYLDIEAGPSSTPIAAEQKISDTTGGLSASLDDSDQLGQSAAEIGDVDGDGITDLAVGAVGDDDGGSARGAVYVLFLNADGTVRAEQKISQSAGGGPALDDLDEFGHGLAGIGDVDGDGVPDLAVGTWSDDDGGGARGAVYVVFLNSDGTARTMQKISDTEGGLAATLDDSDHFGATVGSIGDLDGDGIPDLLVGAFNDDDGGTDRGAVYVIFLNANGTVKAEQKISDTAGGLTATLTDSGDFGASVAGIGDLDGDGVSDMVVGAFDDDDGGTDRGAVHVLFLNSNGTVKGEQKISSTTGGLTGPLADGDQLGRSIAGVGDANGDGLPDMLVGSWRDSDGALRAGAVYLVHLAADGTVDSEAKVSNTAGGLTGPLDGSDQFGAAVASLGDLDRDGALNIAVGARYDDDGGPNRGAAYVLDLSDTSLHTITGRVFEDVDGDGDVGDDGVGVVDADVWLFHDDGDGEPSFGDTIADTAVTDVSGAYSLTATDGDATYWVVANASDITPTSGFSPSGSIDAVLAEQTYGPDGSAAFDGTWSFTGSAGPFFGGARATATDGFPTLPVSDHLARVVVSGADRSGLDFGFSFTPVTNTGDEVLPSGFTDTAAWTTFDAGANGVGTDPDGYRDPVFDGRYVYFPPADNGTGPHSEVLRYDTQADFGTSGAWTTYDPIANGVGTSTGDFRNAYFDGRYVYFVPYGTPRHGEFLRYDTTADFSSASSWTAYDPGANGVGNDPVGYLATAFDGQYLYFAPDSNGSAQHGEVLRFDTSASFTSSSSWTAYTPDDNGVGTDPRGYFGAIFDGRYVYFVPFINSGYHGEVLRYDTTGSFTSTSAWATYDPGANGVGTDLDGFIGGTFDGRYLYLVPYFDGTDNHGEVLRFDTTADFQTNSSWTAYDPGSNGVGTDPDGYAGAAFDGRFVYLIPLESGSGRHGEFLRYDTTGSFTTPGSWAAFDPGTAGVGTDPDGLFGAVFDGRYLYVSPGTSNGTEHHGEVVRYDTQRANQGTLRQFIDNSNAVSGTQTSNFEIPIGDPGHSGGVWTISPTGALPPVSTTATIDGRTQPGWTSTPVVELDGSGAGSSVGLDIDADDSSVSGLAIGAWSSSGVVIDGARVALTDSHVGTDAAGTAARANGSYGVLVRGADATIDRDLVSANTSDGIVVESGGTGAVITNSFIGTDVSGNAALPNSQEGVQVEADDVEIGRVGSGNVISGNRYAGVNVFTGSPSGVVIRSNLIGVGADGTTSLPNSTTAPEGGITVRDDVVSVLIGGIGAGQGNVIATNVADGVQIVNVNGTPQNVAVLGNSIVGNTAIGIDLANDGVTANDAGDGDSGENDLLNFPVITAVNPTTVDFDVDVPAGDYLVEAFRNPSGADLTGFGEAEVSLGFHQIAHTGSGAESFTGTFTGVSGGGTVTLAVTECTNPGCTTFGGTSELSLAADVQADSDGDGLWDGQEDANTDSDGDPSTNPGPNADGDANVNYLDADDDGDGIPTASENADPNVDGDPRDALDSDRDGQPDYLDIDAGRSATPVVDEQKISDTSGGLTAALADIDNFGGSVAAIGDIDGDGVTDLAVGAERDDDGGSDRGAVYVLRMNTDGTVKAEQKISHTVGGGPGLDDNDQFGGSVAGIGDIDGDGIGDLAVGAVFDDDEDFNAGAAYVVFLNADGSAKGHQKISDTVGGLSTDLGSSNYFGDAVAGIGDLDGDGINDLVVGASRDNAGGTARGAVIVLFLNSDGTVKAEQPIAESTGGLSTGLDDADQFGASIADLGDIDGDGRPDIAVSAHGDDDGGNLRGAVYVLQLNANGTVKAEQKISDTSGGFATTLGNEDRFGSSLAGIGDLDGDGTPDLAIGADQDDDGDTNTGAVYLVTLGTDGTVLSEQKLSDTSGGLTGPFNGFDVFGASVAGLGDLDGDGTLDLAVGALGDDDGGSDRGAVYVLDLSVAPCGTADSDFDGLLDCEEDTNTDADDDPSTNPGPDTDGDTIANYLDSDDDGDGRLTSLENADPNGDGDPRDARDTDRDGQPDYLDVEAGPSTTPISAEQKISDTTGGLGATVDDNDFFGADVSAIGDLDGDGIGDIVVGAYGDDDGAGEAGAVHVLFLNANGTVRSEQKISDASGGLTTPLELNDRFGTSVAGLGDLDGDGHGDIAVGAMLDDDGGTSRGAVYILRLNADGTVKAEQKISDTAGGLAATLDDGDYFGSSLATLGDVDGDGVNDLAVGAYLDDDGGAARGAVHVLMLNADGTVKAEQKISDTAGALSATLDDNDWFGSSLAGLGDLDGDGIPDLAVGAYLDDDGGNARGAVHVLRLNANGTVKAEQKISDTQGSFVTALDDDDWFGSALAGLGDMDGDGTPDLAIGAQRDDDGVTDAGAVFLVSLATDGTVVAEHKLSAASGGITGPFGGADFFGSSVAGLGDLDGDGTLDLAVGARNDDDGGSERGAVYVLDLDSLYDDVSGTVFEDVDGDGDVSDDGIGAAGVDVWLFHDSDGDGEPSAGDTVVDSTYTDGSGSFTLTANEGGGTYWVVVNARDIAPSTGYTGGGSIDEVFAEQTYGPVGAATFDGTWSFAGSAGAVYGGARPTESDGFPTLSEAEHVTRAVVAGTDVTGLDHGFSFVAITNTLDETLPTGFTDSDAWATFDPGAAGLGVDLDGYEGAAFDGRYLYFVPLSNGANFHGEFLRYDTTADFGTIGSWTVFDPSANGVGTDPVGFIGGVFDGRYVYFVPYGDSSGQRHGEVLRYDTTASFTTVASWEAFDPGANGVGTDPDGFAGAHFDGRYLYFAPFASDGTVYSGEVMRYDTTGAFSTSGSWTTFDPGANGVGTNPDGFNRIVSDGDFIYFVPDANGLHGEVLRYDPRGSFTNTSSWRSFDPGANGVGSDADGYRGAAFDGRYLYFAPDFNGSQFHGEVLRFDTRQPFDSTASWSAFDPSSNGVGTNARGYDGVAFDGRYLYFAPLRNSSGFHGEVLRFDTTGAFSVSGSWSTFDPGTAAIGTAPDGYEDPIFDGRYVYFAPGGTGADAHGEVLRYDTQRANQGSLRQFIENSNAVGGIQTSNFEIPTTDPGHAGGVWTIQVDGESFGDVTGTVVLDATTQPGWSSSPIIELDGSLTIAGTDDGFSLTGAGSTVQGFAIHSFAGDGIDIGGTGSHTVRATYVGLRADGAAAGPNGDNSIEVGTGSDGNMIGGSSLADRNVIAGSDDDAIWVGDADGTVIESNLVGTDSTGLLRRGANFDGVDINGGSGTVVVDNVIAGHDDNGVELSGPATVTGNLIGVGLDGTTPLGNGSDGIVLLTTATNVIVGGIGAGAGNTIAHSGDEGIDVDTSVTDVPILGNSIFSNTNLAIELEVGDVDDGPTPNDANDVDSGANDLLNYPEITRFSASTIDFDLDVPAGDYLVEAFRNPSGGDPSGHGEAEVALGFHQIAHTGSGSESFTGTFSGVVDGGELALTVTECLTGACTTFGPTSELSLAVTTPTTATVNSTGDG
ncbi:MAG: FG-GAP-like repeat-containing protein, partial [Actinomycetota bacterium]